MPAMGTGLPEHDGTCNDATIAYYRRRAEGGVGMITIEASLVSPDAYGVGPELRLHGEEYIPGLQRLVEALRPYGIPIGIQLWHPGRQTLLGEPIAPSPVPLSSRTPIPHELTLEEIHTLVDYYALSAWVSQQAGFDFVEVHGAHCYLPCEFISPLSNLRTDEYGGSLENRARFPLEIVAAIRERCGTDYPVMYRISGAEGAEGGFEVEDAAAVCQMLRGRGRVRDQRLGRQLVRAPPDDRPDVPSARLPASRSRPAIKRAVSVPVIAVGRLDDAALGGEDPRRRRRRPDRDRPRADRRSRLAAEGAGGKARRDPPLHRLQRVCRSRREREAGPLRRQPRGRARGRVGASSRRRRRAA